jgi:hypothetical protein
MSTFRRARGHAHALRSGTVIPTLVIAVLLLVKSHFSLLHAQHASTLGADNLRILPTDTDSRRLTAEVWAGYASPSVKDTAQAVERLLSNHERKELEELCGRCLADALHMALAWGNAQQVLIEKNKWDFACRKFVLIPAPGVDGDGRHTFHVDSGFGCSMGRSSATHGTPACPSLVDRRCSAYTGGPARTSRISVYLCSR